jgi:hypothetical protein
VIRARASLDLTAAQAVGVKALTFLAGEPERLARFLALTGLGPDTIRSAASSPTFLAAVLDYVVADEELLVRLAGEMETRPETIVEAHRLLAPAGGTK